MPLLPGQFTIQPLRTIGEGGLGIVDIVQVVASNQSHPVGTQLARKRLNAQWASEPGAQQRFEREIQLLASMSHPSIVSLQGVSLPGGERSYFMPYYPATLRSQLNNAVRYPLTAVASLGHTVAHALAHAHGLGYTHRDIKPDNILLDARGNPVISDWGLGQFIHKHSKVLNLTRGGPMGTEYYCSLEQWASGKGGVPGDVYSLGMTLAEVALGSPARIAAVGMGIQNDIFPSNTVAGQRFNILAKKMTSIVPTQRHSTMLEVAADLLTIATA
jgi:serine/threonine protein kinase